MKTSEDAGPRLDSFKIVETAKMKRLEKKKELHVMLSDRRWLRVFVPLPPSTPSPISTLCPRLLIPHPPPPPSPRAPGCLSPSQEKRPHHYQPGQATPGDMASNERKIHPAFSSSPLPLSASIYLSSLTALLHPLTPPPPLF